MRAKGVGQKSNLISAGADARPHAVFAGQGVTVGHAKALVTGKDGGNVLARAPLILSPPAVVSRSNCHLLPWWRDQFFFPVRVICRDRTDLVALALPRVFSRQALTLEIQAGAAFAQRAFIPPLRNGRGKKADALGDRLALEIAQDQRQLFMRNTVHARSRIANLRQCSGMFHGPHRGQQFFFERAVISQPCAPQLARWQHCRNTVSLDVERSLQDSSFMKTFFDTFR